MTNSYSLFGKFNGPNINFSIVFGILGAFIFFLGFALLTPMIIAFIYEEAVWHTFLISASIAFVLGAILYYSFKTEQELRIR